MPSPAQNEYFPAVVSPPGETLQEVLDERSMTQADLAGRLGRPRKTVNEIIKGKAPITPETALQLERVLGVSASFWNVRESHYQEYLARKKEERRLARETDWLDEIPVAEMTKLKWIRRHKDPTDQLREVLGFFGLASPEQWSEVVLKPQVSFRHARTYQSSAAHLAAWLRRGEIVAQRISCASFARNAFQSALSEARRLSRESEFQTQLQELCAGAGVAVVFVPQLPKSRVSGATRWLSPSKALIQLSLRYRTDDHLWFTFFHEAGHILLHRKKDVFIEVENRAGTARGTTSGEGKLASAPLEPSTTQQEAEADSFAAELLIPAERLEPLREAALQKTISKNMVIGLAQDLGIAPGIVVGRLQHLGWLPYTHLNGLKRRLRWSHETR
jgi:HTH-type transcriptional regulator/antitoxin HigA